MATQTENLVSDAFNGMEDALVDFVTTGKANFADLARSIIADIARIQIHKSIVAPLAGALGGLFGVGVAHTGSVVGQDNLATRVVPASAFAGATRFHGGGVIGGEVPIIAQRGEGVFTPAQMRALGAHKPVAIEVNLHNHAPDTEARSETTQTADGTTRLDIIVERAEGLMGWRLARGEGLAQTLEGRYGLNLAAGSLR